MGLLTIVQLLVHWAFFGAGLLGAGLLQIGPMSRVLRQFYMPFPSALAHHDRHQVVQNYWERLG
jgi:hypothetical protein